MRLGVSPVFAARSMLEPKWLWTFRRAQNKKCTKGKPYTWPLQVGLTQRMVSSLWMLKGIQTNLLEGLGLMLESEASKGFWYVCRLNAAGEERVVTGPYGEANNNILF